LKDRLEDPVSRVFRYPLARWIVRGLAKTSITPDQVTLVQPLLAAVSAWLITSEERWRLVLAVGIFELRSILDCVDGTLARAKNLVSPWGHALDAIADWLSVSLLYLGIALHFQAHPPPGPWGGAPVRNGILAAALLQGAIRSFAADHYKQKYVAIFARGGGAEAGEPRGAAPARGPGARLFSLAQAGIGRLERLAFDRAGGPTGARDEEVNALRRHARSPLLRLIVGLWSVSNGDAFVTLVCATVLAGRLWEGQVFFASVGLLWIAGVIALNGWFVRRATRGALTTGVAG
jgi:phosphatidylglycerophosphate synthase